MSQSAVDELAEDVGQLALRVEAMKLCRFDQRREAIPIDRALVVAANRLSLRLGAIGRIAASEPTVDFGCGMLRDRIL